MHRLPVMVFSILAPTLMGVGVVVALVIGATGLWLLLAAAALGGLVSVPLSVGVAKVLRDA